MTYRTVQIQKVWTFYLQHDTHKNGTEQQINAFCNIAGSLLPRNNNIRSHD